MKQTKDAITGQKIYECSPPSIKKGMDYSCGSSENAQIIYNLKADNGAYYNSLGIDCPASFESRRFKNLHYHRHYNHETGENEHYVVGINAQNKLAYYRADVSSSIVRIIEGVEFTEDPVYINYNYSGNDYLVINGKSAGFYVFDGDKLTEVQDNPKVTGAAIYDNKLFACSTENLPRVKFMSIGKPDSWTVNFASLLVYNECGMVKGLATMGNSVYVFQEYGISKISKADTDDYSVSKIWQSGESVYENTICVCGDKIYFCTSGGIYEFGGSSVKKICEFLGSALIPSSYARITAFQGKIYFALKLNLPGEKYAYDGNSYENNSLLIYDPDSGDNELYYGINIASMCAVPIVSQLILAFSDQTVGFLSRSGLIGDEPLAGYYRLRENDFGTGNRKTVQKIVLTVTADAKLMLYVDGRKYSYKIKGRDYPQSIRTGRTGVKIGVAVEMTGSGKLTPPTIYYTEN